MRETLILICCNVVFIGLLPRIFFRKDGRYNLRWLLTAAPFLVTFVTLTAALLGYLAPTPALAARAMPVVAALLTAASAGLICYTLGTHRRPLALWHQENDAPVELVTVGAYAAIRHPFYTSFLLTLVAAVVAFPHPATAAALLYGTVALSTTARREERRLLQSAFGSDYRTYMAATGRFFPRLGRVS
jgi:protein-S-isoprenylcysteine O-methyltransferase Ste14